eukprot:3107593-Rhodomonas_salina.1
MRHSRKKKRRRKGGGKVEPDALLQNQVVPSATLPPKRYSAPVIGQRQRQRVQPTCKRFV